MPNTRIGITMNWRFGKKGAEEALLDSRYLDYVIRCGGVPIPITPSLDTDVIDSILDAVGGVLFTGGLDLHPSLWDEDVHEKTDMLHPHRQEFELFLYQRVRRRRLPIMGICLGIQLLNVARGGSLHQHIPDLEDDTIHQQTDGKALHDIWPQPGSRLHDWLGSGPVQVNSYHHQGVNRLGDGLIVAAHAVGDMIEAIEEPDYPFLLGVQWHPERDPDTDVNQTIGRNFIAAAKHNS